MSESKRTRTEHLDVEDVARYLALQHDVPFGICEHDYSGGYSDLSSHGTIEMEVDYGGGRSETWEFTGEDLVEAALEHLPDTEGWSVENLHAKGQHTGLSWDDFVNRQFVDVLEGIEDEEQLRRARQNYTKWNHWRVRYREKQRETMVVELEKRIEEVEPPDEADAPSSTVTVAGRQAERLERFVCAFTASGMVAGTISMVGSSYVTGSTEVMPIAGIMSFAMYAVTLLVVIYADLHFF